MEKNIDALIRYRAIDKYISEHGNANLEMLMESVNKITGIKAVSKNILKSDIQTMKEPPPVGYQAPVEYDNEKDAYYYGVTGFSLDKIDLNEDENEALRKSIAFLDQLKTHKSLSGLTALIQKLVNTLKIRSLNQGGRNLDFVQSEISAGAGGSQFLVPLIRAIQEKKVLRLYYQPFYEDKPYFIILHPYLLKEYRNRWYLIGLNDTKQELRTYGLDRIWEVESIDQKYIPKKFNARDYFRNTVGIISPFGDPPDIRIEVKRHQANYLITQPLHESQYIESEDEDKFVFGYKVHPTYEFKSYILSMGSDVRVLSPETLKKDILRELNDCILEYGK